MSALDTSGNKIFTTPWCPYCINALKLLDRKGVAYENIDVSNDHETRAALLRLTGSRTVPQIFIGGKSIGGCDDLYALEHQGRLDGLLTETT